jgi:hypothetical protein
VLRDELAQIPAITVVAYGERVCGGERGSSVDFELRPDGAHLTDQAAADTWRWLAPQLDAALAG